MSGYILPSAIQERENKAYELRVEKGYSFERIAKELGYANRSSAQKAYHRACGKLTAEDVEQIANDVLQRMDRMIEPFYEAAVQGNPKAAEIVLSITDRVLRTIDRNKAIKIEAEVINYDGYRSLDAEVIRIARVIEFIEGNTADITTLPQLQNQSEPDSVATPSPERTVSPGE